MCARACALLLLLMMMLLNIRQCVSEYSVEIRCEIPGLEHIDWLDTCHAIHPQRGKVLFVLWEVNLVMVGGDNSVTEC